MKPNFGCVLLCFTTGLLAQRGPGQKVVEPFDAAPQQDAKLELRPFKLDCMHLEYMKKGRPVFVGADDGVRIGISTQKDVVAPGDPIIVDLWIDNRTDKPTMSGGRCGQPHSGDVFDESGHRLISFEEQAERDAEREGKSIVWACASTSAFVEIPAHTCKMPGDAGEIGLKLDYKLAPGVYYVFPIRGTDPALFKRGLVITVRRP